MASVARLRRGPFLASLAGDASEEERVSCSFRVDAPLDPVHSSASPDHIRAVCPDPHAPMLPLAPTTPSSTRERPMNNDDQPPPLASFTTNCSLRALPTRLFIARGVKPL